MWLGGHLLANYMVSSLFTEDRNKTWTFVVAGAIPDVSYVCYHLFPGPPVEAQRPWWTHSLLVAPLWGTISSLIATRTVKYWKTGTLGVILHLIIDTFVYVHFGVRWLGPLVSGAFGYKIYDSGSPVTESVVSVLMLIALRVLFLLRRRDEAENACQSSM